MKKIILILMFLPVLVAAEQLCMPAQDCRAVLEDLATYCSAQPVPQGGTNYVCNQIPIYKSECGSGISQWLCKDGYELFGAWYCDIEKVVRCPNGCDSQKNVCMGAVTVPDCSEGFMQCGTSANPDPSALYVCTGGKWVLKDICAFPEKCVERSASSAVCLKSQRYCINSATGKCFLSSSTLPNCYDSLDVCESNRKFVCRDTLSNSCAIRAGGCAPGELESWGSDLNAAYAECVNLLTMSCTTDEQCHQGGHCDLLKHVCVASPEEIRDEAFPFNAFLGSWQFFAIVACVVVLLIFSGLIGVFYVRLAWFIILALLWWALKDMQLIPWG